MEREGFRGLCENAWGSFIYFSSKCTYTYCRGAFHDARHCGSSSILNGIYRAESEPFQLLSGTQLVYRSLAQCIVLLSPWPRQTLQKI